VSGDRALGLAGAFVLGAVLGALAMGLVAWFAPPAPLEERFRYRDVETVAQTVLLEARKEEKLLVHSRGFVSTVEARVSLGIPVIPDAWQDGTKRVRVPVRVGYTIDMASMTPGDLAFDRATRTLRVRRPPVRADIAEVDLGRVAVETRGALVIWWKDAAEGLDRAAYDRARREAIAAAERDANRKAASADADRMVARILELPLRAAGFQDVQVEVVERG